MDGAPREGAKNPAIGYGLEQVASLPLGTNRSVALVRVGTELHLLGIAEHGVTTIRTFTEDEASSSGCRSAVPATVPAQRRSRGLRSPA